MPLNKPTTINKIHQAIAELHALGTRTTTRNIGKHLGISHQRVHEELKKRGKLSILDSYQQRQQNSLIVEALKDFDTANLSIKEIYYLPIDGLNYMNYGALANFLRSNNIPHSYGLEEKLATIDTSQYTIQEIHGMVGGSFLGLRNLLYKNKIPFKSNKRNREKMAALLEKLRAIDTKQYTLKELHEIFGEKVLLPTFYQHLVRYKIPYKKIKRH